MSDDVKAKDVLIVLGIVAAVILVLTAAVWLFTPSSYGTVCFMPAGELEEGVETLKITDEILAEYPMIAGPPKSLVTHDTVISKIFGGEGKVDPAAARDVYEKFGSKYLDYDGEYYVIVLLVE